jgi:hypothetical protein
MKNGEDYPALRWNCPWCNLNFHAHYSDESVINEARKVFGEHMVHHIKTCSKRNLFPPEFKLTSV